eukprot:4343424-Amphidinium_carterae.1
MTVVIKDYDVIEKRQTFQTTVRHLGRADICGLNWHLKLRACSDAVMERSSQIVLIKHAHDTFTVPAMRFGLARVGLQQNHHAWSQTPRDMHFASLTKYAAIT